MREENAAIGAVSRPAASRIAAIDVLRGLAIAAVVMRHVSWRLLTPAALAAPGGHAIAASHLASGFGVPLFVAVSVLGLVWRHGGPLGGVAGYATFLASRATRLLPAYVLWSLTSLAARDLSLLASPGGVAHALLAGTADVQFYFVPMIFELYVLWPLLRLVLVRRSVAGSLVVLAAGAWTADLAWRGVVLPTSTALAFFATAVAAGAGLPRLVSEDGGQPYATIPGPRSRMLAAAMFVASLAILHAFVDDFLAVTAGTTSREALYLVGSIFAREPTAYATLMTGALAILAGTIAPSRIGAVLAALGRASYGIYLVHLLIASTFVYRVFDLLLPAGGSALAAIAKLACVWFVTLAASHAVTTGLARHPRLRWMVGSN